ncbi:EexN family lipoprotein [Halomonas sp. 3A7M]|uniref:EexN family lipoprotein n=1 Tax=Halomonas sp. 3A7M TaxID=2742616 RepID=UPI0018673465|nr:EexN family lipoprotein [Halomonas sp. 3A7M]
MKAKWMTCIALFPLLAACQEDAKPVEWWMEHTDEREEKLEECRKDEVSINCENARQAAFNIRATGGNNGEERSSLRITR